MPVFISFCSVVLNLAAFVLLLLVSLSGLVIPSIYLFIIPYVPQADVGSNLNFGLFGFCDLNLVGQKNCYGPQLHYSVPLDVINSDGLPFTVLDMFDPPLQSIFTLHPFCVGFSFICAILSLFIARRVWSPTALTVAFWNAILVTIAFAADVATVSIAKNRVDNGQFVVFWGAAPWMTLAACVMIWTSVLLLSITTFNCCGSRRKD